MTAFVSISESFFDRLLELGALLVVETVAAVSGYQFKLGAFGQVGRFVENEATIADPSSERLHGDHLSTTLGPEPPLGQPVPPDQRSIPFSEPDVRVVSGAPMFSTAEVAHVARRRVTSVRVEPKAREPDGQPAGKSRLPVPTNA